MKNEICRPVSMVVGASAGLGRALSEELARSGNDLFLVASDLRDLEPLAKDLSIRFGAKVHFAAIDIATSPAEKIHAAFFESFSAIDGIFLVSGISDPPRDFSALSEAEAQRLIDVNLSAPVKIVLLFLRDLGKSPAGNIVGIGSVAQARARGQNTIYGASKSALEFFFHGLRHRISETSCRIQFYRAGYLATQMTFGQTGIIPIAPVDEVARKIVAGMGADRIGVYLPFWWRYIMMIYRLLPWFVFRRLRG